MLEKIIKFIRRHKLIDSAVQTIFVAVSGGVDSVVLLDVMNFSQQAGFSIRGLIKSPLLGPKGNAEFLVWLNQTPAEERSVDVGQLVVQALGKSQEN